MMAIKVTKLKNGIKKGTQVPFKQQNGNVGNWAQQELKNNGYELNTGKGPDSPSMGVEYKTRKLKSTSAHTIGSMTIQDIKNIEYEDSTVREKLLSQYRIHYDDDLGVVTDEGVYDFSDSDIQKKLKHAYELGRQKIINGNRDEYIPCGTWGQFEKTNNGKSYVFRIPNGAMKKLETMAKNSKTFNRLFK